MTFNHNPDANYPQPPAPLSLAKPAAPLQWLEAVAWCRSLPLTGSFALTSKTVLAVDAMLNPRPAAPKPEAQPKGADADAAFVAFVSERTGSLFSPGAQSSTFYRDLFKAGAAWQAAQPFLPAQAVPPEHLPTAEHIRELAKEALDQIMEQAQVFASAWSLVGGLFDSGNAMSDAEDAKAELRTLVRSLADLVAETVRPAAPQPEAQPEAQPRLTAAARERIGQWLASDMAIAVRNGANSVSMPNELVEIAAWLCAAPSAQAEQKGGAQ